MSDSAPPVCCKRVRLPTGTFSKMKPLQPAVYNPADRQRQIDDICRSFQHNAQQTRKLCGLGDDATREDCVRAMLAVLDDETKRAEVWKNDQYQVSVRRFPNQREGGPDLVHLSIKRLDKAACRDWRDFQAIKNQLVGPECEGVELYPAESRVVDTANQYHVWVIDDATYRFPFGYAVGVKMDPTPGTSSRQRAFEG